MSADGSRRCWAHVVGDCGGPISREHYVSRTLWLSPHVTVSGLPGSDGPRTIGLDAMVIRSLCKTHNEALSDLDLAAGDVVRTWRWLNELRLRTARDGAVRLPYSVTVDGWRMERWALKTVFNIACLLRRPLDGWMPSPDVARYVFGGGELHEGAGLSAMVRVGERIVDEERLSLAFGKRVGDPVPTAVTLNLRNGLRFLVTWDRAPAAVGSAFAIDGNVFTPDGVLKVDAIKFDDDRAGRLNITMRFDWTHDPNKPVDRKMDRIRRRYPSPAR